MNGAKGGSVKLGNSKIDWFVLCVEPVVIQLAFGLSEKLTFDREMHNDQQRKGELQLNHGCSLLQGLRCIWQSNVLLYAS